MAETNPPSGQNDDYKVVIEEVNIADPGLGLTLMLQKLKENTFQDILIKAVITDVAANQSHASSVQVQMPADAYLPLVIPFQDNAYKAGNNFTLELEVSFPNSSAQTIQITDPAAISGQGGRFDYIDVPYCLVSGQRLEPGQYFRSANNAYFAYVDYQGKFGIYPGLNPRSMGSALFSFPANYDIKQGLNYVVMQGDGNFCMYGYSGDLHGASYVKANNTPAWESSACQGGNLILTDGGNLAIQKGTLVTEIEMR